jgi:ubiquinone/menaquinone biosynthesis C-methylase UbiE
MPDFTELKQRAAAAWSNGAFEEVADNLADMHAALVRTLGPRPGERWLDLGCGVGSVAELAAGAGADVTGIDLAPRLVEVAKARAAAGGFDIAYAVGDAEHLVGIDDMRFDVVASSVAMVFAPDHGAVAREVARVVRPGGRLGFTAWTKESSVADMFRLNAKFMPPPPEGAGSPLHWGDEQYVRDRLAAAFELRVERRISVWEGGSVDEEWAKFARAFGPVKTMLEHLPPDRSKEFEAGMRELMRGQLQADGRVREQGEYLLVTGLRR